MSTTGRGKLSAIDVDGAMTVVPGYSQGAQMADQMPVYVNSPLLSLSTAASADGQFMVPFDATIVAVMANITELPDDAAGLLNIGSNADADKFLDDYSIATDADTGLVDLVDELVTDEVDAGDVIEFSTDGGATSTGSVAVTLVLAPRLA